MRGVLPLLLASVMATQVMGGYDSALSPLSSNVEVVTPQTYRLAKKALVRKGPKGPYVDVWPEETLITSNIRAGNWIKVTGYFPDDQWHEARKSWWVRSSDLEVVKRRSQPKRHRPVGIDRYIVVDKSAFELKVVEAKANREEVIYRTQVAVGIDRCLSKDQGGNCYFTEPGTYHVRWKIFDPEGIQWCVPKFMEQEDKYASVRAGGQRCFRGSIGTHALNIGKSYAIHGTNNPSSIGKKASHGCIRASNRDMEKIYSLMEVGDPVYIRE